MLSEILMFIPLIGRFILTDSVFEKGYMHRRKESIKRRALFLIENTLLYFVIGVNATRFFNFPWVFWSTLLAFLILGPLEYKLQQKKPRWFGADFPATKFEFFWLVYHAFWFVLLGWFTAKVMTY